MFIPLILLPLLLLQFSYTSANRYGAYCTSDTDCDRHQKCTERVCHCNINERRFWTGEICAICIEPFTVTYDRCYKSFNDLKTWADARAYCRARYADLFTWRNNVDEQFIRPVIQTWAGTSFFAQFISQVSKQSVTHPYIAWAGATIISSNPHITKWVDPDGIKLDLYSNEWCDPTIHAGYVLPKEPSSGSKKTSNGTENEACVTYNFGTTGVNLLCLADDYCSQKYPFICEMNAASMKLANSVIHGTDGDNINFEEAPPPPPPSPSPGDPETDVLPSDVGKNPDTENSLEALANQNALLSMQNIIIFAIVAIILIVGGIFGYKYMKKKKANTINDQIYQTEEASSQGRPSFTSTVNSIMDE